MTFFKLPDMNRVVMENPQVNEENSKRKLGKTVLDNFSKLTNNHEHVRAKSAASLLKHLSENDQNENGNNELKYALKRLVRGLGAPTPAARAGYYSTLVALLNINKNIRVPDLLELVKSELHKSGKNNDGENADICAGQILTCGALIRARLWEKCDEESQMQLLQLLITSSKERTYLGLVGFSFVSQLFDQLTLKDIEKVVMPFIKPEIAKPWLEQTLDSLFLLLNLRQKFPKACNAKFLKKTFGTSEVVCTESLENIGNILMTIPRVTSLKHPLYDTIVNEINPIILPNLFYELDKHLKTPNRNRLLVFIKMLTNIYLNMSNQPEEVLVQIPKILTRNFITQLLGYFRTFKGKQKDKEYQEGVHNLFQTLLNTLKLEKVNSKTKISVLKKLLFDPGTFIFEKVTNSKIIQQITLSLDPEGVKSLADVYRGVADGTEKIDSENDSETWLNNDRLYSAHLLIKLLNLPTMKSENQWKVEQLSFLMGVSLLKERNITNIGRELADSLKTAFFGALGLKLSKLEELHTILSQLVQTLNLKIAPENLETILRTPITPETYELWQRTIATVHKIEKKKKKNGLNSVFLTLFYHMGLQLFNDVKLASDSLKELFSCYSRVKKDKKMKHNRNDTEISDENSHGNDPLWIEVVTDLFLNLLSHNSHLLRSIIKCVFPHLCPYMTSTTIHQILSVLDSKNDENPLSKNEESDSESDDEVQNEDSDESEGEEAKENHEESDDNSEDDEEGGKETVNDKLRSALHHALANGGSMSDDDSIDLDQMSETEGENLDRALADAFKQFKPNHGKRKKQAKDEESLTHFRVRVLDLIEIYLDSNPSMLHTLEIMLPLLQAVEFSIRDEHQKPLNDRLKSILKKLLGLKKFSEAGVGDKILIELLKSLLEKGTKNVIIVQDMGEQIADCCIFVVKCSEMLRSIEDTPKKVKKHLKSGILEVISGEINEFVTKRDCLTPYVLFKNLVQTTWEGNIGLSMILLEFMFNEDIRQFKKNQVAELLKIFYSNQRFLSQNLDKCRSKLEETHEQFLSNVVTYLKGLCEEPNRKNVKEKFVCIFFNLLSAMKQCPLKIESLHWASIGEQVREYRSYKTFSKDAKVAFNKLCRVLGVSYIVKMKNQPTKLPSVIEDVESVGSKKEEKSEKKKKHKKLNKEKLKLKKEAKTLRLESLSRGLTDTDFERATGIETNMDKNDDSDDMEEHMEMMPKNLKKRRISVVDEANVFVNGLGTTDGLTNGLLGHSTNEEIKSDEENFTKKKKGKKPGKKDKNSSINEEIFLEEETSVKKKKRKISKVNSPCL